MLDDLDRRVAEPWPYGRQRRCKNCSACVFIINPERPGRLVCAGCTNSATQE